MAIKVERICQYTSIMFAGNVCVLLIVAIATDYWEYRGFNFRQIINSIPQSNATLVSFPKDTDSYLIIRYFWTSSAVKEDLPDFPGHEEFYEPPTLVQRFYREQRIPHTAWSHNGTHELARTDYRLQQTRVEDVVLLFSQYGNLVRDCLNLEAGVRERLRVVPVSRCSSLLTSYSSRDRTHQQLPILSHLERLAFVCAFTCLLSFILSITSGVYGFLLADRRATLYAAVLSLTAGISLVLSIALFHGKCHAARRRKWMNDVDIPHKSLIDAARVYQYGWSFLLAWLCVVLCFVLVWTYLADMETKKRTSTRTFMPRNEHIDQL